MPQTPEPPPPVHGVPPTDRPAQKPRLNWAAVIGFGSVSLVWPVMDLTGLTELLGPLASIAVALLVIGLAWVLGAGLGGVPRPVLTLTVAGAIAGALLVILALVLRQLPDVTGVLLIAGATIEIGRSAALGALAGLLANLLQRTRRA